MHDLRVVFMGTPEFAVPVLEKLIANTNVVLVVTKQDAPVGRKRALTPSPVSDVAMNHHIPVLKPKRLREEYESILNYKPDIVITCAYGQIVPKQILDYPEYGCINIHASLLPKYRGASPIYQCLRDGETKSGVTIMYMDENLDTGNIINAREVAVLEDDTLGTLSQKLSHMGAELLMDTLPKIYAGENFDLPQDDEEATMTHLLKREDEVLDFSLPCEQVYNHVRSLNPEPLANTMINGEEWKIVAAVKCADVAGEAGRIVAIDKESFTIACQTGGLKVLKIKRPGKNIMSVRDLFNGYDAHKLWHIKVGE